MRDGATVSDFLSLYRMIVSRIITTKVFFSFESTVCRDRHNIDGYGCFFFVETLCWHTVHPYSLPSSSSSTSPCSHRHPHSRSPSLRHPPSGPSSTRPPTVAQRPSRSVEVPRTVSGGGRGGHRPHHSGAPQQHSRAVFPDAQDVCADAGSGGYVRETG